MRHSLLEGLGRDLFFLEPGWATVCWKKFWGASGFLIAGGPQFVGRIAAGFLFLKPGWATVCWKEFWGASGFLSAGGPQFVGRVGA